MAHPGGRPRRIKSPEEMEDLFIEYKTWASQNPWIKKDFVKSGEYAGQIIDLPIERALTEWGFAVYIGLARSHLIEYGKRPEFRDTYSRIKDEMTEQRVSGGLACVYNANLVARIDGITEKNDLTVTGKVIIDIEDDNEETDQNVDSSNDDRSGVDCDGTV